MGLVSGYSCVPLNMVLGRVSRTSFCQPCSTVRMLNFTMYLERFDACRRTVRSRCARPLVPPGLEQASFGKPQRCCDAGMRGSEGITNDPRGSVNVANEVDYAVAPWLLVAIRHLCISVGRPPGAQPQPQCAENFASCCCLLLLLLLLLVAAG